MIIRHTSLRRLCARVLVALALACVLLPGAPGDGGRCVPGAILAKTGARGALRGMDRALLDAVLFCDEAKARGLLAKGADPNARAYHTNWAGMTNYSYLSGRNFTALMVAADRGCVNLAALLIGRGADITLKDANGSDALDIAREMNNADMVEFLKEKMPRDRLDGK